MTDTDRLRLMADERDGSDPLAALALAGAADEIERLRAERNALREALTPSAETKAAYIGEVSFLLRTMDENGDEWDSHTVVPWTAMKDFMALILRRALASPTDTGRDATFDVVEDGQAECHKCGEWYHLTAPRIPHRCEPRETVDTCAHFDESSGKCLFATRNWSPACTPRRCVGCPTDTGEQECAMN